MNTNQLKKFAQTARIKLLEQIEAKLNYVLNHDTAELRGKSKTVNKLKEAVDKQGKAAIVDKVAYTWFNRLVALRFMDVNGYQPLGISVLTPAATTFSTSSELLDAAHAGNIPHDLQVNRQEILDILDGRVAKPNPDNEVFRILLVATCNHLHGIFPFLFEKIDDYSELLLPDDLTSPFSIVRDVVDGMSKEDCKEVEIIGWLYQFYISEKKDQVFASKTAVKKEDIPAATQLFTPRWIVEYMVQNTVGKLWLQNRPSSKLKEHMPYFIDSPSLHADDYLKVNSVEEIKLLDQASGSGHILVYGFELFYKIYEEEGYNPNEIPAHIIKHNLYGFEIDERAAQLAGFAILMKARSYYRRIFRNPVEPNILCYQDLPLSREEIHETFAQIKFKLKEELEDDLTTLRQATNYGSLIVPKSNSTELSRLKDYLQTFQVSGDAFLQYRLEQLDFAVSQLISLSQKYHCVVDNPPYMGGGNMNKALGDYVKTNYPDSKADLMACFIEAGLKVLHPKGFLGMINQHSWMFLSSYEALRKKLIENTFFDTLLHLGPRTFPEIGGEVVQNAAFTFWHTLSNEKGAYIRLVDFDKTEIKRNNTIDAIKNPDCGWFYTANQKDFEKIPGSPISFWTTKASIKIFEKHLPLKRYATPSKGMMPGPRFIRFFWEINADDIALGVINHAASRINTRKWYPYFKGGEFRKWYGNREYVVDFFQDGINLKNNNYGERNPSFYFLNQLNWTKISSSKFSIRDGEIGGLYDDAACQCPIKNEKDRFYLLGYLNSNISNNLLKSISNTLNFSPGEIAKIPVLYNQDLHSDVSSIGEKCVAISKENWDSLEFSRDFKRNFILSTKSHDIEESYELLKQYWSNKFFQLHLNEKAINRLFIEAYGLQKEVSPDVPLDDVTILQEETSIENGELVFHADEIFAQFISYAVGCMFGRYSLDKEGLILANQGETLEDYMEKIGTSTPPSVQFLPDEDNVIPVLDDDWFEDDIVARFHAFLKASFGEAQFQKNLAFVEECLGKDIRKYFVKDFYKDHIKRYKKRPIYWMFSSPKGYFNVLIYMHRYTPDSLSTILNGYLREFMGKLELHRKQQEHIVVNGSPTEQNRAQREIDKLDDMLADCRKYEAEILYPLAAERISIDLDDGVLVNYNKFGAAIAPVDGLNDKKTKKKVMEFDWIDTTQIR